MPTYASIARTPPSTGGTHVKPCHYPTVDSKTAIPCRPLASSHPHEGSRNFCRYNSTSVKIPHPLGGQAHILDLNTIKNETGRENLKRHCQRGHWVKPTDFQFGDVVNMCVSHDIYGQGVRYYQFWKLAEIDGQQCPLFLTQITNGHRGPSDSPGAFCQTAISFVIEDRPERNVFVNAANIIALIPPSHGRIFVQMHEDRRGSDAEFARLWEHLNHLSDCHPGLLRLICQHTRHAQSDKTLFTSIQTVKKFLQQNGQEKCRKVDCRLCKMVLASASRRWNGSKRRTTPKVTAKINPEESLCAFLTGQGRHFEH